MRKTILQSVLLFLLLLLGGISFSAHAQVRTEQLLEKGWKFSREDSSNFSELDFNDTKWKSVTVPHDWAIYGPFGSDNDMQEMAIVQDGQTKAEQHAGRTGGLPFVGVGWYRLELDTPNFEKGNTATLIFDGAMSNAEVYVNGSKVGHWPYGYNSFHFDVSKYLKSEGKNSLAVRLENKPESSRWYPGAGLYRNVHLVINQDAYIPVWGTQLTTPVVTKDFAKVNIKTKVEYLTGKSASNYTIITELLDKNAKIVASNRKSLTKFDNKILEQDLVVENPLLWDTENPNLYKAVSKLYEGDILKDEYTTSFGIRTIEIIPDEGFFLNGKRTVFQGLCMHHDLGPLGAAVNDAAIRRQIRILKEMGANAIRTSHNMPAPELIRACDEMGMMVMAESFDEWKAPKMKNGYNFVFDEWAEKDLVNLIHQFRNNPSVMMWCIGNEVPDQHRGDEGAKLSLWLQNICKREDPTRFVTQGMDAPDAVMNNNFGAVMEVLGFNYRPHKYQEAYDKLPQRIILGSETTSTVSSRGIYKFPVERQQMKKYADHQSSSYDVEHCGWSNLPEDDFIQHEDLAYCIGEFVWTGFDYLGEPTPYYTDWPSHSSLFGIVDLAGIPKDRYYLYRSHWNREKETLHILPHWNWEGREGEITPVFVYTNYPSAELFVNGKSQGVRTKDLSVTVHNSDSKDFKRQERYRLMWMDTKYEAGTLKVVAYDKHGKTVAEKEIHTAGKPHRIEMVADRSVIKADGKDLSFITVKVVDKDGNLCPNAQDLVKFKVKGAGTYRAGANGNSASLDLFHESQMHFFNGMLVAIVQSTEKHGTVILEAEMKGVQRGKIEIETRSELKKNEPCVLFSDYFDGVETLPDTTTWKLCTYANNTWSQYFKDVESFENVRIDKGYLKLKATKDGSSYKNGGIRTKSGFKNNTRLEVKARLTQQVRGALPAIWQMPLNGAEWPRSGEIDLMEWVQDTPNQIFQTVHTFYINGANGSVGVTNSRPNLNFDVTKDHIYAADRTDDAIIFYVDGIETWRYENMYLDNEKNQLQFPFNKFDFDIILNYSLGGMLNGSETWPGKIHDEDLPGEMWIDWVKVWELD